MTIFGIDISEWQGALVGTAIDWPTVASQIDFGVYRVGNGHRFDKDLAHNRDGARLCAISGSYWYFERPGTNGAPSGRDQIRMWIDGAQFQPGEIAQADIEGTLNGNDQNWLLDACHAMDDYLGGGHRLFIYSNLNFAFNVLTDPEWQFFPLWCAYPNGNPGHFPLPFGHFNTVPIHQFGFGTYSGISGQVDADSSELSVEQIKSQYGLLRPDPVGVDTDMALYRHTSNGAVYEVFAGYKFHCTAEYFYDVVGGSVAPNTTGHVVSIQVANDDILNALPDWPGINPPAASYVPHTHNVAINVPGTQEYGGTDQGTPS